MSKNTEKSIYKIEKENQILRQKVSNLTKEIEKKNETIEQRDEWIKSLKQALYGKKSEKTPKQDIVTVEFNQLTIFEAMDGYQVDDTGKYLGYLMCDGYAGYNVHSGKRLACWAHVRRQFFKLASGNANAKHILKIINKLYKIEKCLSKEKNENDWSEEERRIF